MSLSRELLWEAVPLAALEAIPNAALITDVDGNILWVNAPFTELTGYAAAEAVGLNPRFLRSGAHDEHFYRELWSTIRAGRVWAGEMTNRRKDGSTYEEEQSITPVRDVDGAVCCFLAIKQDITRRKRALAELLRDRERLRARVNDLEQRHREMTLLNDMAEVLPASATAEEAYRVIAQFAPQLFPGEPGFLGILNAARNVVNPVVTWGEPTTAPVDRAFAANDCWALRRGQMHLATVSAASVLCKHLRLPAPSAYLCIPLSAHNQTFGVLHLRDPVGASGRLVESKRQLAVMLARHIELALANLNLRETLRGQSIRDPLTGLYNRRYMEESLAREIARAVRSRHPLGIIMLDLDHFKAFNDTFGHEAGDSLLRELGVLLRTKIRTGDIACRYGGEEFTLIVAETSLEAMLQRAENLCELVARLSDRHDRRSLGPVTVSLGVAMFPTHGSTPEDVLRAADAALYRAKAEGRDRVVIAS